MGLRRCKWCGIQFRTDKPDPLDKLKRFPTCGISLSYHNCFALSNATTHFSRNGEVRGENLEHLSDT